MALVWLEFVYFEAPELEREGTNLDNPLGIGSLAYTGATAAPLIFRSWNPTERRDRSTSIVRVNF